MRCLDQKGQFFILTQLILCQIAVMTPKHVPPFEFWEKFGDIVDTLQCLIEHCTFF